MKEIIERFTIGGTGDRPSMPSRALQEALGTIIRVNVEKQILYVPIIKGGYITASKGDTIICYNDGTYGVEKGGQNG